ncbi:AraC family transcriptional regulator [Paenibacillus arenilitoris]|uniref:AraC family transcriptional regulator n=1 Tax=Paenibacillus arenilitoris TaxID=2772299 RepID=A0A927H7Q0_9BACL|nr:AraC family transcriptional regulator [Paenibacillus arenilitoris]MBD2871861.1 AraC family transcriptional regulator [Paenibacillus arenilitoris]
MKKKKYTSVSPHRHDFIEFSLVLEGRGKERINGAEHDLRPGTLVLLLPYQIHEYRSLADDRLTMYICNFDMQLLATGPEAAWGLDELLLGRDPDQPAYVRLPEEALGETVRLWDALYGEYESSQAWRPIVLRSLLLQALSQFVRHGSAAQEPNKKGRPAPSSRNIWPVVQYVYEHFLDPLSLQELSERFHVHPTQLSSQFGEQFGLHFVDFLHELRIRHACSLLLSSTLPIAQIAFESGFSSYPTFSRVFLRLKGVTPRQYRERRNGER